MGRDNNNPLGVTLSIKFDPEQFDTLNHKLDKILAQLPDAAKLASVTAGLKASEDALSTAVEQNQPKP